MSVLTVLYLADVCLLELPALHAGCSSWLRLTAGQHPSDVGQCAPALSKTHTHIYNYPLKLILDILLSAWPFSNRQFVNFVSQT